MLFVKSTPPSKLLKTIPAWKGILWSISTRFTFASADTSGLPPSILTTGVSRKSNPLLIILSSDKEPDTVTVPVAPVPDESETFIIGGLMTS